MISDPITFGGVILLLIMTTGKLALSLSKRIKKSSCHIGADGLDMTTNYNENQNN